MHSLLRQRKCGKTFIESSEREYAWGPEDTPNRSCFYAWKIKLSEMNVTWANIPRLVFSVSFYRGEFCFVRTTINCALEPGSKEACKCLERQQGISFRKTEGKCPVILIFPRRSWELQQTTALTSDECICLCKTKRDQTKIVRCVKNQKPIYHHRKMGRENLNLNFCWKVGQKNFTWLMIVMNQETFILTFISCHLRMHLLWQNCLMNTVQCMRRQLRSSWFHCTCRVP